MNSDFIKKIIVTYDGEPISCAFNSGLYYFFVKTIEGKYILISQPNWN